MNIVGYKSKIIRRIIDILNLKLEDYTIVIYRNRVSAQFDFWFRDGYHECNKDSLGIQIGSKNRIEIYAWKHNKDKYYIIRILHTLLHEIRHGLQILKYPYAYRHIPYINYDSKNENNGYNECWHEIDANSFAKRVMNDNRVKINKILKSKLRWKIKK